MSEPVAEDEVLAQNKEEVEAQIAAKDEWTEDPGQLSEELLGDYQRRVQMGVNPNELAYDDDDDEDSTEDDDES